MDVAPAVAALVAQRFAAGWAHRSPIIVAAAVTVVYGTLTLVVLAHRPVGDFAFPGREFISRSATSATIARHVHATTEKGYDGQFALYIALDPVHAAPSIDKPVYRYSHILYPALASAVAAGNDSLVPAALVVINLFGVFFGTLALGLILRRHGLTPLLATFFAFFAGVLVAFDRDLGDLLAYALVALGLLALRWDRRGRIAAAGVAFASAALARETTLIFPAILCIFELAFGKGAWRARLGRSASLAALAALPYAAWRLFVLSWLGSSGSVPSGLAPYPFAGLHPHGQPVAITVINVTTIVTPALLLLGVVVASGVWRQPSPYPAIVVVQVLLLVVFLPAPSYLDYFAGTARLQIGTVVAALCCTPSLMTASLRQRQALGIAAVLALAPSVVFVLGMLGGKPV